MPQTQKAISTGSLVQNPFDEAAPTYQEIVNQGLSVTGESLDYFARARVSYLKECLDELPKSVLDYGCGTGTTTPLFFEILGAKKLIGIDQSFEALNEARRKGFSSADFHSIGAYQPTESIDLAYSNTVFHHIPVDQRDRSLEIIYKSLRPGGYLAFWENNLWNPGTRWVMSRIPFDHDAILLPVSESKKRIRDAGFSILRTDHLFIFPGMLRALRPLERLVTKLPIGGQYLILAKKP